MITQSLAGSVDLILGPLLIGAIFNAFVYGICFLQFSIYWTSQWNDSYDIKCDAPFAYHPFPLLMFGYRLLVAWTFLLDTFHTSALTYVLWVYVVDHFLNPSFLRTVLWPYSATPIVTTLYGMFLSSFLEDASKSFSQDLFPDSSIPFLAHQTILKISTSFSLSCAAGFRSSIIRFYLLHHSFPSTRVSLLFRRGDESLILRPALYTITSSFHLFAPGRHLR